MTEEAAQNNTSAATDGNEATTQTTETGNTLLTGGEEQQGQTSTETTQTEGETQSKVEYTDFTLPEGLVADDVSDLVSLAQELGLDQDKAQKLIDREAKLLTEAKQSEEDQKKAADEARTKMRNGWYEEVMKDKEIGGDNFKKVKPVIDKARNTFASPELNKFFEDTGLGNHPLLVKLFYNIGKAISEDTFHAGSGEGVQGARSTAQKLYPSMQKTG